MVFYAALFALLGIVVASFVHVVVERIYTGQSWTTGRSCCSSCRTTLSPLELIPVVSWVALRGRCYNCGSRIPVSLFVGEVILGCVGVVSYLAFGISPELVVFFLYVVVLFAVVLYDVRHTIVPPVASGILLVLSVVFSLVATSDYRVLGLSYITAGCIGLGFFLLHLFSKGRAMGLGDAPIALSLSILVAPYALGGLLFSFWIGAVVGIAILVMRRGGPTMGIEVPFVPFLALGYLLAYFFQWNPFLFFV